MQTERPAWTQDDCPANKPIQEFQGIHSRIEEVNLSDPVYMAAMLGRQDKRDRYPRNSHSIHHRPL